MRRSTSDAPDSLCPLCCFPGFPNHHRQIRFWDKKSVEKTAREKRKTKNVLRYQLGIEAPIGYIFFVTLTARSIDRPDPRVFPPCARTLTRASRSNARVVTMVFTRTEHTALLTGGTRARPRRARLEFSRIPRV